MLSSPKRSEDVGGRVPSEAGEFPERATDEWTFTRSVSTSAGLGWA